MGGARRTLFLLLVASCRRRHNPPFTSPWAAGFFLAPLFLRVCLRRREKDVTKDKISKILASGANVILTSQGIDDMAMKYFVEAKAIAVRRVEPKDMRRIASLTGGEISEKKAKGARDGGAIASRTLGRALAVAVVRGISIPQLMRNRVVVVCSTVAHAHTHTHIRTGFGGWMRGAVSTVSDCNVVMARRFVCGGGGSGGRDSCRELTVE